MSIIMPILGGSISQYCGWRYVYLIACIAAILMIIVCFMYTNFKKPNETEEVASLNTEV